MNIIQKRMSQNALMTVGSLYEDECWVSLICLQLVVILISAAIYAFVISN